MAGCCGSPESLLKWLEELEYSYWARMTPLHDAWRDPAFPGYWEWIDDRVSRPLAQCDELLRAASNSDLAMIQRVLCEYEEQWSERAPNAMSTLIRQWALIRQDEFIANLLPVLAAIPKWCDVAMYIGRGAADARLACAVPTLQRMIATVDSSGLRVIERFIAEIKHGEPYE